MRHGSFCHFANLVWHSQSHGFGHSYTSAIEVIYFRRLYLLATLRKKLRNGFAGNFREGWQWANEHDYILVAIRIEIRVRICIATLVRCALAEVCTVPLPSASS